MKNTYKTAAGLLILLSLTILAGCGEDGTKDNNYHFYGTSEGECKQILYTCPQNEESFTNTAGCGCKPAAKPIDNTEERSSIFLITRYLKEKTVTPIKNGKVAAEFVRIGAVEQGKNVITDVYAIVDEFYIDNNKIAYGAKKEGIMQFTIEQTNINYIIRGVTVFDIDTITEDQKKLLSEDTQKWLADKAKVDELRKRVQTTVKQDGAISFGRVMEDFVDYVAPAGAGVTQEGTQQGTQQSTQKGAGSTEASTQQ